MKSNKLATLIGRYEQRSLRERAMLFICLLVVLLFLWNLALMQPLERHQKRLQGKISQVRSSLGELKARKILVEARRNLDPDRENRQQLAALQAELDRLHSQLNENVIGLIPPREMPDLLKQVLKQQKLQLLSLENLPAEKMKIGENDPDAMPLPGLFRHRLKMEFSGDYLSTLNYLRGLERLPSNMVWDQLEIESLDYPRTKIRLEVYTLSLSEGWIGG